MKIIGKIFRILGILLLAVVVLTAAADAAWVGVPELASAHAGDDYIKYNNIRDSLMAQNVQWIAEREDTLGRPAVMISGHNGHVAFQAQYYSSMGSLGEGYNFLMKLIPTSHRVSDIPSQLYSAMIYVYKASPISPA